MRTLIAEDELISRRLLEASLSKWGYEVVVASNGAAAWNILEQDDAPRLTLLDWMMPELDGVELCRRVRRRQGRPYVYIILLTAKSQKQDLLKALDAGADDYLTKPFDAEELRARLRGGRRILELQDELIAAREALRFQATHDALTGLYNRGETLKTFCGEKRSAAGANTSPSGLFLRISTTSRKSTTPTATSPETRSCVRPRAGWCLRCAPMTWSAGMAARNS